MGKLISKGAGFLLAATLLSGCMEKSDSYNSVGDARASRVFEKGWLPDFLPASTRKLKVSTSVEISAGRGSFSFSKEDYAPFLSRLAPYNGALSKVEADSASMKKMLGDGYEPRSYASGSTNWVFLCSKDEAICNFFVWQ